MDEASSSTGSTAGREPIPPELLANSANLDPESLSQLHSQLQQYRQKQMDLIGHFHRAQQELNMQHMQSIMTALGQTQQGQPNPTPQQQQQQLLQNHHPIPGQHHPQRHRSSGDEDGPVAPLTLASSLTNLLGSNSSSMPQTPTSKGSGELSYHNKKCEITRTNSTTISQLTKDRLKSMIANRRGGEPSSSSSSATSSYSGPTSSANHTPVKVSSPHFEPYRLPSNFHNSQAGGVNYSSEFQLRKVNSEPNLKMRIRAKLLSKGSSPVQSQNNQFYFAPPTALNRCDSELSTNMPFELSQASPAVPHVILPSPSLPNLAAGYQNPNLASLDLTQLMAAANNLAPFLSLPSLLKAQLEIGSINGEDETRSDLHPTSSQNLLPNNGPLGGYQSLLKQQIRELVLRRKSLVREEPEDAEEGCSSTFIPPEKLESLQKLAESAGMMTEGTQPTGLAYDSTMLRHECGCGISMSHVEHGGRVVSIWNRLVESGLVDKCERVAVKKASVDQLKLVHSPAYTTFFAVSPSACLKMSTTTALPVKSFVQLPCGGIGVDSDTYFNDSNTQSAARMATGCLIELSSQVAEGKLKNGFACIRPPGHHAERETAMGFCFFNNVAVTARYLQARYPKECERIAIIDWDVHHGNGTQLCFEEDPRVLYMSLHRHDNGNFFPGTGSVVETGKGIGRGFTVNIPFSGDVMKDADYLAAWRNIVEPILAQYQPTFILVSAGFDAACGHPAALGGYEISAEMFGYMTQSLMGFAEGRVCLALEGGYDLNSISNAAEQCVKMLSGSEEARPLNTAALESVPCLSAQETIQKVIAIHKSVWSKLTLQPQTICNSHSQYLQMLAHAM